MGPKVGLYLFGIHNKTEIMDSLQPEATLYIILILVDSASRQIKLWIWYLCTDQPQIQVCSQDRFGEGVQNLPKLTL